MKSSGIGGQAVLEGIMMRNKSDYAIVVRKPDGEIKVQTKKCTDNADRKLFFRLPLVRGVMAFVDSLYLGMSALTYSASFYEDEEPVKKKKKTDSKNRKAEDAASLEGSEEKSSNREQIEMILTVVLAVVLALAIFVALPFALSLLLNKVIHSTVVLAVIEGLVRVALFVGYVFAISFMEDIHRVFMYHGAEHKAINCVEQCEELTVANVRRQSKEHRRCGTSFLFVVMFISIIFFMFLHFDNMWMRIISRIILIPVVAGVSYEFILWSGNSDSPLVRILSRPGMWLQRLTTREPDDSMLEVAIASVEAVFDWKEYQSRVLAMEKSKKRKRNRKASSKPERERDNKKSRAQVAEELRKREEENAKRANERARLIKEREQREAEVRRQADEAAKRHAERKTMSKLVNEMEEGELDNLDHFFNDDN